jgi:hypothetical protein
MPLRLPTRCSHHHTGPQWHWTERSREVCRQEQLASAEYLKNAPNMPYLAIQAAQHSEFLKQQAAATAAHVPVQTTNPDTEILNRNGEIQLLSLNRDDLKVIGLLTCADIFNINRGLRKGSDLSGGAGFVLDCKGYASKQKFVNDAIAVFLKLGGARELDEPIRLFRGIGLPLKPDQYDLDVAGLSDHLQNNTPWTTNFTDLGFMFANTRPQDALHFNGVDSGAPKNAIPILFELEADRGLCAPQLEYRTTALFDHVYGIDFLDNAHGQVIFPPGSEWEIVSVDKISEHGVPLVRMKQVS